jgi:hypothetical protein
MTGHSIVRGSFWLMIASALCLAGMWLYMQRVLVAYQVSDAAAHGRPRGNLSDLYPRWLGARELLLHGRDPYSPQVTREIQAGYYGRPLDASRPGDPKDQQAFAYPVYVVFYLAPTVRLPFDLVRQGFFWFLLALTLLSIPIWLRVVSWRPPWSTQSAVAAFTIGSLVVLQGLKLQQMTLLVAALLAIAIALLMRNRGIEAGVLLALATIKPQLVFGLLLWLAIWTVGDWKQRYRWMISFLSTVIVLCVAAEMYLPHWISRFWQAAHEYQAYTGAVPLLDKLIPTPLSRLAELAAGIGMVLSSWKYRKAAHSSTDFALMTCLVLALTLMIVPTYALYNQVLLIPSLLLIARDRRTLWDTNRVSRFLIAAVAVLLIWPYFSGTILAGLSFVMSPEVIQKAWAVPGWTALTLPVAVAALMWVVAYRGTSAAPAKRVSA